MDLFYLTTTSLPRLSLLVLTVGVFAYFVSRIRRSPGTGWLALALGGFALHHAAFVGFDTVFSPPALQVLYGLSWSSVILAAWAFVGVAYAFLGTDDPHAGRAVLAATGVLSLASAVFIHLGFGPLGDRVSSETLQWLGTLTDLSLGVVTVAVLVRRGREPAGAGPPERRRKAFRTMLAILATGLTIPVVGLLRSLEVISFRVDEQIALVLWAVVLVGIVTLYVNYDPAPTSFLAKVVSFAFVAVVTALGVASVLAFPAPAPVPGEPPQAVRFVPDAGGYRVAPGEPFDPDLGAPVVVAEAADLALGFAFPFADTTWTHATVDDDGIVTFGPLGVRSGWELATGSPTPWIAPLLLGLDGDSVWVRREPGRALVTWHEAPPTSGEGTVTAQLALAASGEVGFRYGPVPDGLAWGRGLSAGPAPPSRAAPAPGGRLAAGGGVAEVRWADQLAADQRRAVPYALLLLGAGVFVLAAFPLYLREGLTRPLTRLLGGVRRAARGHLDADVPVGARDEIGVLTEDFNRMTGSLRTAEAELRRYADELESRVEARTAQLAASLADLKAAQARLIQQEKLASLGQLTAGIAHEIKNPLNFVTNFADLSAELVADLDTAVDADERAEIMEDLTLNMSKIAEHGRRADAIVRSMMDHARPRGGDRQPVDIDALVAEYAGLAYQGIRARRPDTSLAFEQDLGAVGDAVVSEQDIGRVLINLLDNAFAAVRDRAASGEPGYAPRVVVSTRRTEAAVAIHVADNGTGMPAAVRERVFEPFFTTRPTGQGTGLGLSIAYDIVAQGHGGTMTVESAEGEGTTFGVVLPAA